MLSHLVVRHRLQGAQLALRQQKYAAVAVRDEERKKCGRLASLPLLWQKLLGNAFEQRGTFECMQKVLSNQDFTYACMYASMYAPS